MTPYFIGLYRLIGQTRDITMGRGEYSLAYMQIAVWYEFYPEAAKYALKKFVHFNDGEREYETTTHPYGSWKDIKYFCDYYQKLSKDYNHPLIEYAIDILTKQIKYDEMIYNKSFVASSRGLVIHPVANTTSLFRLLLVGHLAQLPSVLVGFSTRWLTTISRITSTLH